MRLIGKTQNRLIVAVDPQHQWRYRGMLFAAIGLCALAVAFDPAGESLLILVLAAVVSATALLSRVAKPL